VVDLELDPAIHPILVALVIATLAGLAEWLHVRRVRRVASLAFGPRRRPAVWAMATPWIRAVAMAIVAWGLATLVIAEPKRYSIGSAETVFDRDPKHVVLVLDVSPSMRLVDAGPSRKQSRMQRARDVMESFFDRVPLEQFRVSVIATYNGAKPVVIDTRDFEVVRNILGDLPMHWAFPSGRTKIFDGLEEAARLAKPWNPRSTTVVLVSDGDTVPANGMPKMPASVGSVVVVGVGDPSTGKFIDGRQSRQDVPTLRQIAARLGGTFHNGNEKHIASGLIAEAFGLEEETAFEKLTRREYALIACAGGSLVLALLPWLLHFLGTSWRPGVRGGRNRIAQDHARSRQRARIPST
jgi:Ca-activated chloride channel family protein